jgi:hypothetical protein
MGFSHQLRQLGDIRRDSPRIIACDPKLAGQGRRLSLGGF